MEHVTFPPCPGHREGLGWLSIVDDLALRAGFSAGSLGRGFGWASKRRAEALRGRRQPEGISRDLSRSPGKNFMIWETPVLWE